MSSDRTTGIALIVSGLALLSVSILELAPGEGRGNGDDAAESLDYLAQFGLLFSYSGLALVIGGVGLVVAAVGTHRVVRRAGTSLAFDALTAIGVLSGGFFAASGVMRMNAVGTVPEVRSLDQAWGESAYLTVLIAGTQGLLATGMIAIAAWLVGFAILARRKGVKGMPLLAIPPAIMLLVLIADLALPFLAEVGGDGLFPLYIIAALVGIPLACVGFGIAQLRPSVRERLGTA
jgi:hypothetical protein